MAKTRTPSGNEDSNKFTCRRCGFRGVDLIRDKTGPGSGIKLEAIAHTGATAPDNPVVVAGCPFCGSKNFRNWKQ